MRKKLLLLMVSLGVLCSGKSWSQTLIHYWNFNNSATEAALLAPASSIVPGASVVHIAGGTSEIQITSNTGQGFEITNPNARNGDAALTHLRLNNPIGAALVLSLPTTGYTAPVVKYASRRSGSGAGNQFIDYSVDGVSFVRYDTLAPVDGNPTLQVLDFSLVAAAANNPNFKVRITFEAGAGGTVGNNRFDNLTLEGTAAVGSTDTLPPSVAFTPVNNALNVAVSVQPVLSFSEDIRLVSNVALNNTNVDTLIELRLSNASGVLVPFDASINGRDITVVPAIALQHNQVYYLALKANVLEDMHDNAITSVQSITFSTIALQTQFQAGDLAIVAYRMNAQSTDDEIAVLTLVDILPGTMIMFTDAKYTDNAVPQCAGGLTWTAPAAGVAAGTVIAVKNDIPSVNIGTLTGSSFGLSSGGDQVIVYTGTAVNPSYITALSSNAWVTTNTSCGGSNSKLPAALTDGQSSLNLSTAQGNVSANTVNAYYTGPQDGTVQQLKTAIFNPANWIGTDAGTAAQLWPNWAFPGPPSVVSASVLNSASIRLIFSRDLDHASATNTANYTGIAGLNSVTRTMNGSLPDTLVLNYSSAFSSGMSYTLSVSGIKDAENRSMVGVYTFTFNYDTQIGFDKKFISVSESAGMISLQLNLKNPANATADLVVKTAPFSTAGANDFTLSSQTLHFTGASSSVQIIEIPVIDDNQPEQDEYFVLSLENLSGCTLTGSQYITIYIKDNDRKAPAATKDLELSHIGSFKPGTAGSSCEIVVHDAVTQRLFITSAIEDRLDIADFSDPASIRLIKSVDMQPYGGITSVAVKNGVVAVASPNADEQLNGSVVFFNTEGVFQKQVTVGALPDMITFTPDGNKVLTANEGQPNDTYTVDPEGSVSIIDISGGIAGLSQANVTTLLFDQFNSQEASLIAAGVRKLKQSSTLSQDLEPEYISVSEDSKTAWVSLQENNAIATINLETKTVSSIWPLGTKDYSAFGNGFDASDNSGVVHISNWPVKAFYIPDAIANYSAGGKTYLVTANEGDEKEYQGLTERTTVGSAGVILDPVVYPNAAVLKEDHNIGRLRMTNLNGKNNNGQYEQIYVNGARSFSIFDTDSKQVVYDSGDDFEMITSTDSIMGPLFNADNESNGFKSRSRAKGPEPEGVVIAAIGTKTYAFIGLERVGGIMAYDITDPSNVKFVDYKNSRSITSFAGDHGPEGVIFVSGEQSPNGKSYVLVSNEISGTVSVFELLNVPVFISTGNTQRNDVPFIVFPNPNNSGRLNFSKVSSIELTDLTGRTVLRAENVRSVSTSGLTKGLYIIKTSSGETQRVIVE